MMRLGTGPKNFICFYIQLKAYNPYLINRVWVFCRVWSYKGRLESALAMVRFDEEKREESAGRAKRLAQKRGKKQMSTRTIEETTLDVTLAPERAWGASLRLTHEALELEPGRAVRAGEQALGRVKPWSDGYSGENVALERALTRGLELVEGRTVTISPLSTLDDVFPAEPAALIILNTLVRLVREAPERFEALEILLRSQEDVEVWSAALVEVERTMMG